MSGLGFGGVPLSLVWELLAIDKASPVFNRVGASATATATATERAMARYTTAMRKTSKIGASLTKRLTLPLAAVGALSVKAATDFNSSMTKIQTQAGGTAKDVQLLSKQVLALSDHTQQGPVELANALYHLKSVGLDNVGAMKALKQASDLAAVGGAGLEETTNALAGAWRTGIRGAKNFHQAVSTINAIIGAGNMHLEDFNAAIGTGILPTAKTFGLTLKDVGAALAVFTDEGVPADAAATRLRMSFSLLGAPSQAAEKQLSKINLTGLQLANDMRKPDGLITAIGDLKDHLTDPKFKLSLSEQSQLLSHAFGGGRSSSAILSLINNFDVLKKKQQQVTDSMKKFDHAVKVQQQTPQAKFKELEASLQHAGILLGNVLLPFVTDIVQKITAVGDWFNNQSDGTKKFIAQAGLALLALGPVLSIIGKVGVAMKGLATIVMFGPQFAAGILGAETALGGVRSKAFSAGSGIRTAFSRIGAGATGMGRTVALAATTVGSALAGIGIGLGVSSLTQGRSTGTKVLGVLGATAAGAGAGFALSGGNPIGAVIGGIAAGVTSLAGMLNDAGDAASGSSTVIAAAMQANIRWTQGFKSTVDGLVGSLKAVGGAMNKQYRQQIISQLGSSGVLGAASQIGFSGQRVVQGALGNTKAQTAFLQALGRAGLHKAAKDFLQVAFAAGKAQRQYQLESAAAGKNGIANDKLGISLKKLRGSLNTANTSLKDNSAITQHNKAVIGANVQTINQSAAAQLKHGRSVAQVAAYYERQTGKLQANAHQIGFNKQEVGKLIGSYGKLPARVVTYLEKRGVLPPDIQAIIDRYAAVPKSISTTVTVNASQAYSTLYALQAQYANLGANAGSASTTGSINFTPKHGATGFGNIPEGMFTVGERGWELGYRRGNQVSIFSNAASQSMTGLSRVPGFAKGTAPTKAERIAAAKKRADAAAARAAKQLDTAKTNSQDTHSALHSLESALSHFGKQIRKTGADVKSVFSQALAAVKQLGASKEAQHRLTVLDNKLAHKVEVRNRDMNRLQAVLGKRHDLAVNVRRATVGSFDLSSSGTGFNGEKKPTFGLVFAQATQQKNIIHKWAAGLRKLAKVFGRSTVGQGMLRNLAEAGPASYPQVQALASASAGQLSRLVGVERTITRTAASTGTFVGGQVYGSQVRAAQRQVQQDRHQAERLFHMLDHRLKSLEHSFQVTVKVGDRQIARAVAEGNRKNQRRGAGR